MHRKPLATLRIDEGFALLDERIVRVRIAQDGERRFV
jgi:hypothetical protein